MDSWLLGGIVGGVAGGLAVAVVGLLMPRQKCVKCGATSPKFRQPASWRQALFGGWTCPECGCEMDRRGRRVGA